MKNNCHRFGAALTISFWWVQTALVSSLWAGSGNLNAQSATYVETVKGVSLTMVKVDGGSFVMDCTNGRKQTDPGAISGAEVTLSPFHIGETEVTQGLWRAVLGDSPAGEECDECPVVEVSWGDIQVFLLVLNRLTGKRYRLPTEAEWEYAACGGPTGNGYKGPLRRFAWYDKNADGRTHPVKSKKPNGLGLYDMLGNVWELCSDRYDCGFFFSTDPMEPAEDLEWVCRGGFMFSEPKGILVSERYENNVSNGDFDIGFRLVSD